MSKAVGFSDVPDNHWAAKSIEWGKKFIDGRPDGTFGLGDKATREEIVSFFHKYHLELHQNLISNLVETVKPAVVVVRNKYITANDEERMSIGTGTIINEFGDVLTNYHCIDPDQDSIANENIEIGVLMESNDDNIEKIEFFEGEFITGDKWIDEDMAIVRIKDFAKIPVNIQPMPILAENLAEGKPVISYGHGGAYKYAVGDGVIAQDNQIIGGVFVFGQTNATINSGNSGGLISSIYKRAIAGIPARKVTSYDDISFFIPASKVLRFLSMRSIKHYQA